MGGDGEGGGEGCVPKKLDNTEFLNLSTFQKSAYSKMSFKKELTH